MSTKRTTISHLISLEIQILAWDIHKIVAGLNPVNGIPTLSFLIIGSAIQYSYGREKNNEYPVHIRGGSRGGGADAPPKIGKKMIFWRKIVIFHTKYPKNIPIQPIHIFFIDNVNMDNTITE
jgi:hypothetical protein